VVSPEVKEEEKRQVRVEMVRHARPAADHRDLAVEHPPHRKAEAAGAAGAELPHDYRAVDPPAKRHAGVTDGGPGYLMLMK